MLWNVEVTYCLPKLHLVISAGEVGRRVFNATCCATYCIANSHRERDVMSSDRKVQSAN